MSLSRDKINENVLLILRKHRIKRASFFGSYARGESKRDSDIDILVEFIGSKSLLDLSALKIELEKTLGRKVDVLTYNSLHPLLKERILEEQVRIL